MVKTFIKKLYVREEFLSGKTEAKKKKIDRRGRKGEVKEDRLDTHKDVCLTCMRRCHSSSHRGIWMPHRKAKHKSEQRDTHGVSQTIGLSRAVHTKAAPALPPCTDTTLPRRHLTHPHQHNRKNLCRERNSSSWFPSYLDRGERSQVRTKCHDVTRKEINWRWPWEK